MPPIGIALAACLAGALGCADATSAPPDPHRLKIGATWGLTSFAIDSKMSGSSANAVRLIVDSIDAHVSTATRDGRTVRMRQRPDSQIPVDVLARSLRYDALVSATVADHQTILATFSDEASASRVAALTIYGGFALGPFELEKFSDGRATLVRKADHPINEIVIEEVSASDEWRRFLGGGLDVIPIASILHRERFIGMPSVKIVDYPPVHSMGLLFNTVQPTVGDPLARRKLAALLDRTALSRALLGSEKQARAAVVADYDIPQALVERPLLLAFVESDIDAKRTAAVIRYQLAEHNVKVDLVPLDTTELVQRWKEGLFDMTLLPIPEARRGYTRFLSEQHPESANITGYANPAYDDAYDSKQTAVMDQILLRDVPATPLYTEQYFAAVRSDLCLGEEPDSSSWRWLAALYPCDSRPER